MAFLFNKFQGGVRILVKSPTFANKRKLQFEDDINFLFMYTSYNGLGMNADEADVKKIIDMAIKFTVSDCVVFPKGLGFVTSITFIFFIGVFMSSWLGLGSICPEPCRVVYQAMSRQFDKIKCHEPIFIIRNPKHTNNNIKYGYPLLSEEVP